MKLWENGLSKARCGLTSLILMSRHEEACSVCLGEYEVNERVKRLPPCGHEFHEACIDLWLTNHVTCPMCRCSLLPPQVRPVLH